MFHYEWKKLVSKKLLCVIFVFFAYIFIDYLFFQESDTWRQWFISYTFDIKLMYGLLIFILSPMFSREKELEMFDLIVVSKRGVTDLPKKKLLVSFAAANLMLLIFCVLSYVSFGISHSIWDWNVPIDDAMLQAFLSNADIVTYKDMLSQVLFNSFLSINLVAALTLFVSSKCKQSVQTVIIVFAVNFVFGAKVVVTVLQTAWAQYVAISLPVNMIWNNVLNTDSVLIGGWRIQAIYIVQILYFLIILVLYRLICITYKHRR